MIDYRVQLFWSDEDGRYVADIPELAPCTAVGATPEEALARVEALKSARARSQSPPAPAARSAPDRASAA